MGTKLVFRAVDAFLLSPPPPLLATAKPTAAIIRALMSSFRVNFLNPMVVSINIL
jgi:hypothetical protein